MTIHTLATCSAAPPSIRILLVEDNLGDAFLLKENLKQAHRAHFAVRHVETLTRASKTLASSPFDLVVLDLGLPDSHGIHTFEAISYTAPPLPIVIVSGCEDPELKSRLLKLGAADFVVKGLDEAAPSLEQKLCAAAAAHRPRDSRPVADPADLALLRELWFQPWYPSPEA